MERTSVPLFFESHKARGTFHATDRFGKVGIDGRDRPHRLSTDLTRRHRPRHDASSSRFHEDHSRQWGIRGLCLVCLLAGASLERIGAVVVVAVVVVAAVVAAAVAVAADAVAGGGAVAEMGDEWHMAWHDAWGGAVVVADAEEAVEGGVMRWMLDRQPIE